MRRRTVLRTRLPARVALPAPAPPASQPPEGREDLDPQVVELIETSVAAVQAAPRSVPAWTKLCLSFEANLLWPEAADCYRELATLEIESAVWRHHRAVALLELGEIDEARSELEAARRWTRNSCRRSSGSASAARAG